ncbi:MAG: hypothetical protein J7K26_02975 [Candidatus Aenigmarchaeota archaeon]|nr:hypothetical protein [Candidatus Aenigmarchaeota archaeon]
MMMNMEKTYNPKVFIPSETLGKLKRIEEENIPYYFPYETLKNVVNFLLEDQSESCTFCGAFFHPLNSFYYIDKFSQIKPKNASINGINVSKKEWGNYTQDICNMGRFTAIYIHKHPGIGEYSTILSGTDKNDWEELEKVPGKKMLYAILSSDGQYIRFYSKREFTIIVEKAELLKEEIIDNYITKVFKVRLTDFKKKSKLKNRLLRLKQRRKEAKI